MKQLFPLALNGLTVRKSGRVIVGPLFHSFTGNGATIVIGPNGAGKTTFLKAIHGLERVDDGQIVWPEGAGNVRKRQGFVFQLPRLLRRTALENIAYPLRLDGIEGSIARKRAESAAVASGLDVLPDRPADVLSAGEKQKLAIARAMIRKPDMLILDEPTANLDGRSTREIEALLGNAREDGTFVLMATHDMGQAERLADDIVFIYRGQILEAGNAERFFKGPATAEARRFLAGEILE